MYIHVGKKREKKNKDNAKEPAGPRPRISLNTFFLEFNNTSPYNLSPVVLINDVVVIGDDGSGRGGSVSSRFDLDITLGA